MGGGHEDGVSGSGLGSGSESDSGDRYIVGGRVGPQNGYEE